MVDISYVVTERKLFKRLNNNRIREKKRRRSRQHKQKKGRNRNGDTMFRSNFGEGDYMTLFIIENTNNYMYDKLWTDLSVKFTTIE